MAWTVVQLLSRQILNKMELSSCSSVAPAELPVIVFYNIPHVKLQTLQDTNNPINVTNPPKTFPDTINITEHTYKPQQPINLPSLGPHASSTQVLRHDGRLVFFRESCGALHLACNLISKNYGRAYLLLVNTKLPPFGYSKMSDSNHTMHYNENTLLQSSSDTLVCYHSLSSSSGLW